LTASFVLCTEASIVLKDTQQARGFPYYVSLVIPPLGMLPTGKTLKHFTRNLNIRHVLQMSKQNQEGVT